MSARSCVPSVGFLYIQWWQHRTLAIPTDVQGVDYFLGMQQIYMLWGMAYNNSPSPPSQKQTAAGCQSLSTGGCQKCGRVSVCPLLPLKVSHAVCAGMRTFIGINHGHKVKCVCLRGGSGPVSVVVREAAADTAQHTKQHTEPQVNQDLCFPSQKQHKSSH